MCRLQILKDGGKITSKRFCGRSTPHPHASRTIQEELADRANLHRNYIGMIERAERTPTLLAIEGIAKGLQLKASELIARAEDRVLAAAPLPRESAPYSRGKAQAHRPHRS